MTTVLRLLMAFFCTVVILMQSISVCAQGSTQKKLQQKGKTHRKLNIYLPDSILQHKIDSQLFTLLKQYESITQKADTTISADIGVDKGNNLQVDISAAVTDSLLKYITAVGGKVVYPSKAYHTIRAVLHLSVIKRIAARKEVTFIQPAALPANNNTTPAGIFPPNRLVD